MNNEIKEIIRKRKEKINFNKLLKVQGYYDEEDDLLLDYITNLQQKIEDNNSDISNLTYQLAKEKSRNEKALEDIDKFISGHYIEGKGDITVNYLVPNPCCEERLNIIKKDLQGSNKQ